LFDNAQISADAVVLGGIISVQQGCNGKVLFMFAQKASSDNEKKREKQSAICLNCQE
jgi:hypothetical protein